MHLTIILTTCWNFQQTEPAVSSIPALKARNFDLTGEKGGTVSGTRIGEYPVCIGLDVHKNYSYAAVVDELGEIKEEVRMEKPNKAWKDSHQNTKLRQ